jgi:hypothetical protein
MRSPRKKSPPRTPLTDNDVVHYLEGGDDGPIQLESFDAVREWLRAFSTLHTGFIRGREEQQRAELARVLRSKHPLTRGFRDDLAKLFEGRVNGRRLVFHGTKGGQNKRDRNIDIAHYVGLLKGKHPDLLEKQIVIETMNRYNIKSASTVRAIIKSEAQTIAKTMKEVKKNSQIVGIP